VQPRLQLSLLAPYARHGAGGSGATAALVRPCDYPGCHMLWFHQDDTTAPTGTELSAGTEQSAEHDEVKSVEDDKVQEVEEDGGASPTERKVSHFCCYLHTFFESSKLG
jgi:hypothetical protein